MKTIYKYQLELAKTQTLRIPPHSRILKLAMQTGRMCMWCEVNTALAEVDRVIECFGTGHEIPQDMGMARVYLGTIVDDDAMVWHFYERTN